MSISVTLTNETQIFNFLIRLVMDSAKKELKFGQNLTKIRRKFDENSTKIRRKFDENSTKIRRKFDENSTEIIKNTER